MVPDWEKRFQQGETPWQRGELHPTFQEWIDTGFMVPSRILVPGCGMSLEVAALAERGFEVVAIDMSETAISQQKHMLKAHGLPVEAVVCDMFDWQPEKPFDLIYEQTCLCAIEPRQRIAYEKKLYSWLKPEGQVFAQFMQTGKQGGPPYDCDLDAMCKLFKPTRWRWMAEGQQRSEVPMLKAVELGRILKKLG